MKPSTLWHGRFGRGPADALMAFTASLPFDRRLWRDDIAGSRAHVRGLAIVGLLDAPERDAILAALDTVEQELATATFPSSSPTRIFTQRSSDGSPSSPVRPERNCIRRAAATTRWPPICACTASESSLPSPVRHWRCRRCCGPAPRPIGRAISPDTRTCSGPNRCSSLTICSPTDGRWPAMSIVCWPPSPGSTSRRSVPAPWPEHRSPSIPQPWPRSSGLPGPSTTPSTPSAIVISSPRRCSTSLSSASTCRGSARSSCCGPARSSVSPAWTMPTPPARRCSRRSTTRTSPSSPAARPAG